MTRILVIEPSKLIQLGLVSCLSEIEDFKIVGIAESGEEALLKASLSPDIILMNIDLPGMDGIKTIEMLKAQNPGIKIISLFVSDHETRILAALHAGADAYCLKNTTPDLLVQAIQAVEKGHAWLDPPIARKLLITIAEGMLRPLPSVSAPMHKGDSRPYNMTERECLILGMIIAGKSNEEIAQALVVSYHTIKSDITQIYLKMGVHDRVQAAVKGLVEGLVEYAATAQADGKR